VLVHFQGGASIFFVAATGLSVNKNSRALLLHGLNFLTVLSKRQYSFVRLSYCKTQGSPSGNKTVVGSRNAMPRWPRRTCILSVKVLYGCSFAQSLELLIHQTPSAWRDWRNGQAYKAFDLLLTTQKTLRFGFCPIRQFQESSLLLLRTMI